MRRWWRWGVGILGVVALAAIPAMALAGAADHEGTVVLYTASQSDLVQAIVPLFEKKTGIKVQAVESGTSEIIKRAQAEKDNPLGDVFWGVGAEVLDAHKALLEPYAPAELDKVYPSYRKSPTWVPNNVTPMVIVYNKKMVSESEKPKAWKDLADPKWKGKIAFAAADRSGSAYIQLATILSIYGDNAAGWKVVEDIMKNVKVLPSSSKVPNGVKDGEYAIGLSYEDIVGRFISGGAPIGAIYPTDGTAIPPDANAVIKGAKHPKAARLLVDFLLSKEVMTLLAEKFSLRSSRTDVISPPGLPDLKDIRAINYDFNWAADNKDRLIKQWRDLMLKLGG